MANTLTFANQTITDANIFGGISFTHDLNTGEEFSIGNTASASVTFVTDIQLPLYTKDAVNGTFTWTRDSVSRGRYYITEVTKNQGKYTVTAYDAMILADTGISALNLSFPLTVSALATAIATYLGCTVSGTVNNGSISVSSLDESLTVRRLLGYVAEASGCSVKIDGADHLCFMYYASSGITVPASEYLENGLEVADYTCAAIDNVTIFDAAGAVRATYGSGTNTLFIQGNPLLYEATNAVAQVIYSKVNGFNYAPIRCEMFEENGLEVGTTAIFGTTPSLVMHLESSEMGAVASSVGSDSRAELNKSIEVKVNEAMAAATEAQEAVQSVNQHFWYTSSGTEAGAHIAEIPKESFEQNPSGSNLLAKSNGLAVRDGMTERATFGADGQSFNNEYSEPILEVRYLDNATYSNKLNWWEYSGENPFTVTFPWDCNGVNSVQFYDANHVEIPLGIAPAYTLVGRELTFDSATCTEMIAQNVSYVSANYIAEGGLPYYTLGSDGVGSYGSYSTRIGENTVASGNTSLATGDSTVASGANSHAEGLKTTASGAESHSEGYYTVASGNNSHAEGSPASENDVLYQTIASGVGAHAEGAGTQATGNSSHAEGFRTTASGELSHAEGAYSQALGRRTHAGGIRTIAQGYGQTVIGKYNEAQGTPDSYALSDRAFIIGNGTSDTNRSNAFTVDWQGNVDITGQYMINGVPIGGGGSGSGIPYGACSTAAATVQKEVSISGISSLKTGLTIAVRFASANSASNPTLKLNSLTAKAIKRYGSSAAGTGASSSWQAGAVITLTYDGTYWVMHDWNNTTYSTITDAEYQAGTSTSSRLVTPARLKAAILYHAPVTSVNGSTGAVTVTVPTKTSDLTNDSGFLNSVPEADEITFSSSGHWNFFQNVTDVASALDTVGDYIDDNLSPLVGTTADVTPQDVMTALGAGRDICITASYTFQSIPMELKFTAFNRATDTVNGQVLDYVASQTVIMYGNAPLLFTLSGGVSQGSAVAWGIAYRILVSDSDLGVALTGYVPTSREVNNKPLSTNITLTSSDVGAISAPSSASAGDFLVYNGSAWVAQSLSTWQGGNY